MKKQDDGTEVQALRDELATLQRRQAGTGNMAVTYGPDGELLAISASRLDTAADLRALKIALSVLLQQVDSLWLAAVEREAKSGDPVPWPADLEV